MLLAERLERVVVLQRLFQFNSLPLSIQQMVDAEMVRVVCTLLGETGSVFFDSIVRRLPDREDQRIKVRSYRDADEVSISDDIGDVAYVN